MELLFVVRAIVCVRVSVSWSRWVSECTASPGGCVWVEHDALLNQRLPFSILSFYYNIAYEIHTWSTSLVVSLRFYMEMHSEFLRFAPVTSPFPFVFFPSIRLSVGKVSRIIFTRRMWYECADIEHEYPHTVASCQLPSHKFYFIIILSWMKKVKRRNSEWENEWKGNHCHINN